MKQKIQIILLGCSLFMLAAVVPLAGVRAAGGLTVCENNVTNSGQNNTPALSDSSCQVQDLFKLVARVTNFLIGLAGGFAVVRIIIAGLQMVMSGGNPGGVGKAKKAVSGAIQGLVIVMIAFLVVNTIFMIISVSSGLPFSFANPLQLMQYRTGN